MRRLAVIALAGGLAGCTLGPEVRGTDDGIVNGTPDTTHAAVVAVYLENTDAAGLCSGTIVKVDPARRVGWVLTAAHCAAITPVAVFQGNDYTAAASLRYDVVDYAYDHRYVQGQPQSPYDFAVLRIAGVDASTPTMPLAAATDGLAVGAPVTSIGFGRTQVGSPPPADPATENSLRRKVARTLAQVSATQIGYDMQSGGICQGDSGGPVVATKNGQELVVGVHSYVEGDCDGFGVSGRVSADLAFIQGELAKSPVDDCALCQKVADSGGSECASMSDACLGDPECKGFNDCLGSCTTRDSACKEACAKEFPLGEGPHESAANCACERACSTACASSCVDVPKCGYAFPVGSCATCTEASCCQETLDCALDGWCYHCLKDGGASGCATNTAHTRLTACVAHSCKESCATPATTASATAEKATTTTTSSSCAASPRAAGDDAWLLLFALVVLRRKARRATEGQSDLEARADLAR